MGEGISIRLAGATAMMDISDGLAISIHDLMKASGTGCEVSSSDIPCIPNYPTAEALRMALYGGGDFELLFTVPPESRKELPDSAVIIGKVTEKQEILLDESLLPAEGYRHHW